MKLNILLVSFLLIGVSITGSQENFSLPDGEVEAAGPASCGDGICESIEEGVCPQDCSPNNTESLEEGGENSSPVLIILGISALGTIVSITGLWLYGKRSSKDNELTSWIKEKRREGYTKTQLENYLRKQGYKEEEIRKAEESIDNQ